MECAQACLVRIDSARKGIRLIFRNYSHFGMYYVCLVYIWSQSGNADLSNTKHLCQSPEEFSFLHNKKNQRRVCLVHTNPVISNGGTLWSLHKVEKKSARILEGINNLFVLMGLIGMDSWIKYFVKIVLGNQSS